MAEAESPAPPLRRDPANGAVGGVVAGLAARLGVDPVALRVVFVAGVFLTGGALLIAYGIAWVLMPAGEGAAASRALPGGWRVSRGWRQRCIGCARRGDRRLLLIEELLESVRW